jgi:two-component system NtrC family sensor kinase
VLRSIALRLMLGFLVIIAIISAVFSFVGIRFIESRVMTEAQNRVDESLRAAGQLYASELRSVQQVVRLTADRIFLKDALRSGQAGRAAAVLGDVLRQERLDVLVVTDAEGRVLLRPANPSRVGDNRAADPLLKAVLDRRESVAATSVLRGSELERERADLAARASGEPAGGAGAIGRMEPADTEGMLLAAAAPILDASHRLLGMVYGGVLLNGRFDLVDRIKRGVFQDSLYQGKSVGATTLFLQDVRVATTVLNPDGTRAMGTRIGAEIYRQVVQEGRPWIAPTFAVADWYLAAYAPLQNIRGANVGMLGVGLLEAPYLDLKHRSKLLFLAITLSGAALTVGLSYLIAQRLAVPLRNLVAASRRLARGDLDVTVETPAVGEFAELAESFNAMAAALRARDQKLRDFTRRKIMESERLAVIGQLAAGVAHELNNPLQGVVTYSHLLRERGVGGNGTDGWVDKIVTQADRCSGIVRGLLDFARPRTPVKKPTAVGTLLEGCVALVEDQSLFHNIEIVRHFGAGVPEVVVDPSLMQQVFVNLIINAAEAMPGGGRLVLTTRFDPDDGMVEVEFADTGHGIGQADLDRIFDPFFTTKAVGHGTGLGLAISFDIVKEHHGTISVESEVGKGTTFDVRLPLREAQEVS